MSKKKIFFGAFLVLNFMLMLASFNAMASDSRYSPPEVTYSPPNLIGDSGIQKIIEKAQTTLMGGEVIYDSAGVYQFTVPSNVKKIWVTVIGGTPTQKGNCRSAFPEMHILKPVNVTPGQKMTIRVGRANGYSWRIGYRLYGIKGESSSVGSLSASGGMFSYGLVNVTRRMRDYAKTITIPLSKSSQTAFSCVVSSTYVEREKRSGFITEYGVGFAYGDPGSQLLHVYDTSKYTGWQSFYKTGDHQGSDGKVIIRW